MRWKMLVVGAGVLAGVFGAAQPAASHQSSGGYWAKDGSVRPMALSALATPSRAGTRVTRTASRNAAIVAKNTHCTTSRVAI